MLVGYASKIGRRRPLIGRATHQFRPIVAPSAPTWTDARLPRYADLISAAARTDQRQATFSIAVLLVFTICLFASAFLLFLVEPMVAKMVLPSWGGHPPCGRPRSSSFRQSSDRLYSALARDADAVALAGAPARSPSARAPTRTPNPPDTRLEPADDGESCPVAGAPALGHCRAAVPRALDDVATHPALVLTHRSCACA